MAEANKHCCDHMDTALSGRNGCLVEYRSDIRSYSIRCYRGDEFTGMEKDLWYCPWCGTKLPEDLLDKIEEVLEKEYGITEKDLNNDDVIPSEFKTDEWWKKRGL